MTAGFARGVRRPPSTSGPYRATAADIPALNAVFSTAFTDRYRRDGLVGVHVPNLSAAVWRFALADAGSGAMLWRGERDEPVAFNLAHVSGAEGWMGPLAVLPAYQGHGVGKAIVDAAVEHLRHSPARVIGLETMPRTVDNIGFYSGRGFVPGYLTMTVTLDGAYAARRVPQLGRLPAPERDDMIAAAGALTAELLPGYDFTRELLLTHELALGDTLVVPSGQSRIAGFALCHTVPLVEGRVRDELRVLKLVARDLATFDALVDQTADLARRSGTRRMAMRLQGAYPELYTRMLARGARVRWTDLRMTLSGFEESRPASGVVLSNWEI